MKRAAMEYARAYARKALSAQVEATATSKIGRLLDACEAGWLASGLATRDDNGAVAASESYDLRDECRHVWEATCEARGRALVEDALDEVFAPDAVRDAILAGYNTSCTDYPATVEEAREFVARRTGRGLWRGRFVNS